MTGLYVLALLPNGKIVRYDSRTLKATPFSPGQHMAVGPLGLRVAVARELPKSSGSWTSQMVVEVRNIRSGKRARPLLAGSTSWNHGLDRIAAVALGRHGVVVAAVNYKTLLWSLRSRSGLRSFSGHRGGVRAVSLGPKGRLLATGAGSVGVRKPEHRRGGDPSVRLWDLSTGVQLAQLAVSSTGAWIVTSQGYVDASRLGQRFWKTFVRAQTYPGAISWSERHVPGLLRRVLRGDMGFQLKSLRALVALREKEARRKR